jgi:hypothetical protein
MSAVVFHIHGGKALLIRNSARAFAGASIMAICAFGQFADTTNTNATTTSLSSSLSPVGIGTTETVQVILSNTATGSLNATATSKEAAPSCAGSVSFYDASGTIIGTATSFTLTSGQIAAVSLPYASTASASVRELIRAVVSLNFTFPAVAPCSLSYSLATFDTATGVTHAIITGTGISGISIPVAGHL